MRTEPDFSGAKLALLTGAQLVTLLRDDLPHIPWPGRWDFPGGGREGAESPADCVLRETREELGLDLDEARLIWRKRFLNDDKRPAWFFVARLAEAETAKIRLGDEGQDWALMPLDDYFRHPRAIPHLQARLRDFLENGPPPG